MMSTLTIADIVAAQKKVDALDCCPVKRPFNLLGFGLNIIEAKPRMEPVIKLGESAPVSDECRADFNRWLIAMFGVRDVSPFPLGVAYMFGNNIVMRTENIVKLTNCI